MNSNQINHSEDAPLVREEEIASQMLDSGRIAGAGASLSDAERRRITDMQWLDALLEHAHGRKRRSMERALAAVMARLGSAQDRAGGAEYADEECTQPASSPIARASRKGDEHTTARRWLPWAIAASVLLALGVFWQQRGPNQAYAMVEQAYRAAIEFSDRTYRITIEPDSSDVKPLEGKLFVRGGEKFVLEHSGPFGRSAWIGGNGREFWFVPPIGPVLVADSETALPKWMNRIPADMPFLQVTTVLHRIRADYDLVTLPDETLEPGGMSCHRLLARRRSATTADGRPLPGEIEMWSDPATGVVQRLTMRRPADVPTRGWQAITLELTSQRPLGDDTYSYQSYAPDRKVLDFHDSSKN